jgi:hypothetical protein
MKDSIEKFVHAHRDAFDDLEPRAEVWEKIAATSTTPSTKRIEWRNVLWKAAAVLIIFAASFMANEAWHQYRNAPIATTQEAAEMIEIQVPELLEAEVYYTTKVAQRLEEFEVYGQRHPELQNELAVELKELDEAFAELKEDLKDDMANEEILEAMIQNYRIKLKMLEEMILHLKENEDETVDTKANEDEYIEYEI